MTPVWNNGLQVTDRGVNGLVIEVSNDREQAARRFECVLDALDTLQVSPAVEVLLRLPADAAVLDVGSMNRIGKQGSTYLCPDVGYCLEWNFDGGWIDRRILTRPLAEAIVTQRGCRSMRSDAAAAAAALAMLVPAYSSTADPVGAYVADGQAWWFERLSGPIFAHVTRLKPFNLLGRAAFARCASGRPQVPSAKRDRGVERSRALLEATYMQTDSMKTFDAIVLEAGRIARLRGDSGQGRRTLLQFVESRIGEAAREGRAQLAALICLKAAISDGGVTGKRWAPRTTYDYLEVGLRELVSQLATTGIDNLDAWGWHAGYTKLFASAEASQHRKLDAFLQAFHRGMVVLGAPPLPAALCQGGIQYAPAAAYIDDRSLVRALKFVAARANDARVKLQSMTGLLIARYFQIRTHEIFCLRMGDVDLTSTMTLSVNPARADGGGKSPSTKRPPEEVPDPSLRNALAALWRLRRAKDLALSDHDLLFGRPGHPNQRYEQERTTNLMNSALRWGTGDPHASVYDLRHTVFSCRVEPVLAGT
jgi:hypothetical protein